MTQRHRDVAAATAAILRAEVNGTPVVFAIADALEAARTGTAAQHAAEVAALRAELERVRAAARAVTSAADACDREAMHHPSSRSSAPMVRYISAMGRLREYLDALDAEAKGAVRG